MTYCGGIKIRRIAAVAVMMLFGFGIFTSMVYADSKLSAPGAGQVFFQFTDGVNRFLNVTIPL